MLKYILLFVCATMMMSSCSGYRMSTSAYTAKATVCVGDRFFYYGCPNVRTGTIRSFSTVVRKISKNGKWILLQDEIRGNKQWFCIPHFDSCTSRLTCNND